MASGDTDSDGIHLAAGAALDVTKQGGKKPRIYDTLTSRSELSQKALPLNTGGLTSAQAAHKVAAGVSPDAFDFTDPAAVAPRTEAQTNTITVAGLGSGVSAPITISGGRNAAISINGGARVTSGSVSDGDTVQAFATAGACDPGVFTTTATVTDSDGTTRTVTTTHDTYEGDTLTVRIGGASDTFIVTATACATESTLTALTLSDVTLTPAFDPATLAYTASVAGNVATTTVTATRADPTASVAIASTHDATIANRVVDLVAGPPNVITVTVTAGDGRTRTAYTVTVTRAEPLANDASLQALELTGVPVSFARGTTAYTATVPTGVATTTVTAVATDDDASVAIASDMDDSIGANGEVDLADGANVITITVTAADGAATQTYTVTVTRAGLATVTIAAANSPVTEADGAAIAFTVSSDAAAPSGGLAVPVTLTGADDFVAESERAKIAAIAAGATTGSVSFPVINDAVTEPDATVTATIGDSDAYAGGGNTATAQILDDDVPTLTIAATNSPVTEADGAAIAFTITSTPAPAGTLAVTVTLTGADDFVDAAARTQDITIAAGATTESVSFPVTNDEVDEPDATVTATIGAGDAYAGGGNTATAQVLDDDVPLSTDATLSALSLSGVTLAPAFTAEATAYTAAVAHATATTTVLATANDDNAVSVVITAAPGGVTGTDSNVVALEEGANTITITVTAEDGTTTQAYTVTVTRAAAPLPALTLAAVADAVTEGTDANVSFTVTSDIDAPTGGLSVTVTLTGAETFVAPAARTQTAALAAGARTATVQFPLTNDEVDEPDATATATIGAGAAYTLTTATATATVRDDDDPLSSDATLRALSLSRRYADAGLCERHA